MKILKKILTTVAIVFTCQINAQGNESTHPKNTGRLYPYVNLYHQHHDFFNKAFSYQGIEIGTTINSSFYAGVYSSAFVSNLYANVNGRMKYIWAGQAGIFTGWNYHSEHRLQPGLQVNLGYFSMKAENYNFNLRDIQFKHNQLNGFTLSPQVFLKWNICKWMDLKAGLAKNLYYFTHETIRRSDIQGLSFNFGFIFKPIDFKDSVI